MELNDNIHTKHEHASVSMKVVLLIFALVLVATLGVLVVRENRISYDQGEIRVNVGPRVAALQTYTDTATGFSFQHPRDVEVLTEFPSKYPVGPFIVVETFKITPSLEEGINYSATDRDQLKARTIKSELPGTNLGTLELRLTGQQICSPNYTHSATIYRGDDTVVVVSWVGNIEQLIENNPTYFQSDERCNLTRQQWESDFRYGNYPFSLMGKNWTEKKDTFEADLIAGKTDAVTAGWHKDFMSLLETFKFNR